MAARIRIDSLASDDSNAWAVPWKLGSMLAGMPSSCVTCLICSNRRAQRRSRSQIKGKRHHRELALVVDRNGGRNHGWLSSAIASGAGASAAAPVRALLVPASAIVDARLADADPIGTYMSRRAAASC